MTRSLPSAHARRRPPRPAVSLALGAGVLAALLSGCGAMERLGVAGPGDAPTAPAAAPPAAPAPHALPSVDTVRAAGTAVEAGGTVVLHVLPVDPVPQVRVEVGDDATVLTLDPGAPTTEHAVVLAAPAGATLHPQDDDSVVVLGADGTFLGGLGRPLMGPGAPPSQLRAQPDGSLRLGATGPLTAQVGAHALIGADWGEREGGRSLAVEPTPWARVAGQAGEVGTWTELVRSVPEADTATMRNQLTCHALGAQDKDTWNLEPWRPDVGLLMTLAASCNAT